MHTRKIILNNIKDIIHFVNATNKVSCNLDIQSGRYDIDAKSIMGVIGLKCMAPMILLIQTDDVKELENVDFLLSRFYVK